MVPLPTLLQVERDKLKGAVLKFLSDKVPEKELRLEIEIFLDELIGIQQSIVDGIYFDLKQIKKKCDACTYTHAPPKTGTFFDKSDFYLKERSKWAKIMWGLVGTLCTVILTGYLFWFMQVATTVFEIKDIVIKNEAKIEMNQDDIDALERVMFRPDSGIRE